MKKPEERLKHKIQFRVNDADLEKIREFCKENHIVMAKWLYNLAFTDMERRKG